jgi:RHS repeat-associated protein
MGISTINYLLGYHLGSTAITTNSSGVYSAETRYYPWGTTRYTSGTTPTTFRFTGQRIETSFGLYFYGARWFDPYLNRWIQPDVIIPDPNNSQSYDRYAYAFNNPLKYTDPSGHHYCDSANADPEECPDISTPDTECSKNVDCYDAYLTYKQLVYELMRPPTETEILTMTIGSEYWSYVDFQYEGSSTPRKVGREAVARQYYQICGQDECSSSEMYTFMSGYQQWIGLAGRIDGYPSERAQMMLGLVNNDFSGTSDELLNDIGVILDHSKDSQAVREGWTLGYKDERPWQFFTEPMPNGASLGFGANDYAILTIDKGNGTYLFMFTGYQTNHR